jgi:hypothetical protein
MPSKRKARADPISIDLCNTDDEDDGTAAVAAAVDATKPAAGRRSSRIASQARKPDEAVLLHFPSEDAKERITLTYADVKRLKSSLSGAPPEALLLNGPQQQLVRHQLRLRLLDARQTLLMRSDRLYRADLAEAQALLSRYFDLRAPAAAAAQSQLKQLAGLPLSVDLPQVSDSLAALRSLRQGGR